MSLGSIFLGAALLLVVGLFVARPFLVPHAHAPQPGKKMSRRQQLLAQKEEILEAIHDLEFDYETGKIPVELFEHQRELLKVQAANVLKELDALKAQHPAKPKSRKEQDIEAAIMKRRKQVKEHASVKSTPASNGRTAKAARFCPECGEQVAPSDKFCVSCGHKLQTSQPVKS
ncbi:MAG: hypothetical protein Kow0080_17100 [Candidatus Promineifilaceae bacterium]